MIDLYYWPTPSGWKMTIMLEECGLRYKVIPVAIGRGGKFKPEFQSLNPNGRMPTMVDHEPPGGNEPLAIFESGAMLLYLAEKTGRVMRGREALQRGLAVGKDWRAPQMDDEAKRVLFGQAGQRAPAS